MKLLGLLTISDKRFRERGIGLPPMYEASQEMPPVVDQQLPLLHLGVVAFTQHLLLLQCPLPPKIEQ